ncbi:Calcineurin-like phosphoesterase [Rhizoctonia solani]|uniref:Calcineurin-like phosphoesterase n=1 Tax=Rhizoctonia solani TaxID=456999 RepID=A0A8H7LKI6_9AGAM|nr:Calcineurin-like phosphoesterase [Rhizoctonia solani]
MHPDSYYLPGASISSFCHSKKPRKESERAGQFGAPGTDCDTPISLVDSTLAWVEKEWADRIDFVIWTGDNARHDTDSSIPRTPAEIRDMNREIAHKMDKIFTPRGVTVVPSIGGPNTVTNDFLESWRSFVPFPSYQVFQRGVYFSVELVPNQLAAISLNTLYWFDSNKAVDGCPKKGNDPGTLEFDWLEVQLKIYRSRKMQASPHDHHAAARVWLTGHVAPTEGDYFPRCFARYGEIALRYQDTILGHLFGHKNLDHFVIHSIDDVLAPTPSMRITGRKKESLIADKLHAEFKELSKQKKVDYDDYFIVNIGPSVIPEYTPSVRVFTYNITGAELNGSSPITNVDELLDSEEVNASKIDCRKKENKDKKKCVFKKPRHASKRSPSRRNSLWSPTGYAQFYIPESNWANKTHPPQYELEYVTYSLSTLRNANVSLIPDHLLPPELRGGSIESLTKSKYAPFGLRDLTIPSWIKFARKLGERKKLWKRFRDVMFLET